MTTALIARDTLASMTQVKNLAMMTTLTDRECHWYPFENDTSLKILAVIITMIAEGQNHPLGRHGRYSGNDNDSDCSSQSSGRHISLRKYMTS